MGRQAPNWRSALRGITGYDPRKFSHDASGLDDRRMEASMAQIQAEERAAKRIGERPSD